MKATSAYANKFLKKLQDRHDYLVSQESLHSTYVEQVGIPAEKPDFDLNKTEESIRDVEYEILKLKHAINIHNTTTMIDCGKLGKLSIDEALVEMAFLTKRKAKLDSMRKRLQKERISGWRSNSNVPEWTIANYDLEEAADLYNETNNLLILLQTALDLSNNTDTFEIDL